MLFTTYTYYAFLAIAVLVFWALPGFRLRALWLVICSLSFYAFSQGALTLVLIGYILFNWWAGLRIASSKTPARVVWLVVSANLAPLLYFKYLPSGWLERAPLVVPLGISFFAFQASAYVIDVSRGGAPFSSLLDFGLFKSLWAQLVAGPIVRASEFRHQLVMRRFEAADALEGGKRILNGLTKKVIFADSIGPLADQAFAAADPFLLDVVFGTLAFGLQIYFDFSAYSDIAIGSARLVGFRLPENFNWPYAAKSPQEFWQRWHMTLSRWIRDYVFLPLNIHFRRKPRVASAMIVVAMVCCGAWHGAGLTFLLWGLWHGLLLASGTGFARGLFRAPTSGQLTARTAIAICLTFAAVQVGWIFFRATDFGQIATFFRVLATFHGGLQRAAVRENGILIVGLTWLGLYAAQWAQGTNLAQRLRGFGAYPSAAFRACQLAMIIVMHQNATSFVYFQF